MGDVLSQLLEYKWRDVSFPVVQFSTGVAHDHVIHKWADRDGGHVEATGRQPLQFRASIPFKNSVNPGPSETWGKLFLYPDTFRLFLAAFATRTSGVLQHPELGPIRCKPHSADFTWSANSRDGCDCNATWTESLDDTVSEFQDILARKSPVAELILQADALDAEVAAYPNPLLSTSVRSFSFADAMRLATKPFNTITLTSAKYGGYINHVAYRASLLEDAVLHLHDNAAWPIVTACERVRALLHDLKKQQLTVANRLIGFYTVPRDATLASLIVPTRTSARELLNLNPSLASGPVVRKGTVVRYLLPL